MNRASKFVFAGMIGAGALVFGNTRIAFADDAKEAVAHVKNASGVKDEIKGTVTFTAAEGGVKVVADIDGLTPGLHGFHIHEKADMSDPALKSAGGHFNPDHHKHGGPESAEHHAGDLGNLTADDKGHAHLEAEFKGLTIEGKDGVVGHSVIIHAKADDLKTDPSGDSGARIAGGAIEAEKAK
jgi:Cu-Zn family superoxide dismutase